MVAAIKHSSDVMLYILKNLSQNEKLAVIALHPAILFLLKCFLPQPE